MKPKTVYCSCRSISKESITSTNMSRRDYFRILKFMKLYLKVASIHHSTLNLRDLLNILLLVANLLLQFVNFVYEPVIPKEKLSPTYLLTPM
jgi:hypothetical protein